MLCPFTYKHLLLTKLLQRFFGRCSLVPHVHRCYTPANRQKFDRIIIDTAPTGHTLRLLGFPDFLDNFLEKVNAYGTVRYGTRVEREGKEWGGTKAHALAPAIGWCPSSVHGRPYWSTCGCTSITGPLEFLPASEDGGVLFFEAESIAFWNRVQKAPTASRHTAPGARKRAVTVLACLSWRSPLPSLEHVIAWSKSTRLLSGSASVL